MNDSMSILLATTILALGGFGLFMYKSTEDTQVGGKEEEEYDEGSLFSGDFWGFKDDTDDDIKEDKDDEEEYQEDIKPRRKTSPKTHRNKKANTSSKRRYY